MWTGCLSKPSNYTQMNLSQLVARLSLELVSALQDLSAVRWRLPARRQTTSQSAGTPTKWSFVAAVVLFHLVLTPLKTTRSQYYVAAPLSSDLKAEQSAVTASDLRLANYPQVTLEVFGGKIIKNIMSEKDKPKENYQGHSLQGGE